MLIKKRTLLLIVKYFPNFDQKDIKYFGFFFDLYKLVKNA